MANDNPAPAAPAQERETLECPCCGDEGAVADDRGEFFDGQPLVCGCPGHVTLDGESEPWINNGDSPCPRCSQPAPSEAAGTPLHYVGYGEQSASALTSVCGVECSTWDKPLRYTFDRDKATCPACIAAGTPPVGEGEKEQ